MSTFGKRFDRDSAEKSASETSTASIWGFPAGVTTIRFIDDLEAWTEYWEHYDQGAKRFFPCTGDRDQCRGCVLGLAASHRWAANAFIVSSDDPKTKGGYVNLYKIPKTLLPKAIRHADKIGTLLDHDFEVIRTGSGLDTEYDLDRGEKSSFDHDKHRASAVDHETALVAMYTEYMNAVKAGIDKPDEPAPAARESAARPSQDEVNTAGQNARAQAQQDAGEPPFEQPQATPPAVAPQEPEEEISEDAVRAMSLMELVDLAQRAGLEPPKDITEAPALAEWIITTLGA